MNPKKMKWATATACVVAGLLTIPGQADAGVVSLLHENFSDGAVGGTDGGAWTSDNLLSGALEIWVGTGGASARGLSTTYNNDQNAGTPNVNIPGGLEVMAASTPVPTTLTIDFTLPANLDAATAGQLTFFAANRVNASYGGRGAIAIDNLTDNRSLLTTTSIAYPAGSSA